MRNALVLAIGSGAKKQFLQSAPQMEFLLASHLRMFVTKRGAGVGTFPGWCASGYERPSKPTFMKYFANKWRKRGICSETERVVMPEDVTKPEPEKSVQSELAELVERTMADEQVRNKMIDRLQKISERRMRWTPLPEKPEEE
jgi:hypothetical protein